MTVLLGILVSILLICFAVLLFLSIFAESDYSITMIRSDNAEINKAFLDGYEAGKRDGYYEALKEKVTPNMLRQYLGLESINNEKEKKDENTRSS